MSCVSLRRKVDIEDIGYHLPTVQQKNIQFAKELCMLEITDQVSYNKCFKKMMRKYKITPSKFQLRKICRENGIEIPSHLREHLIKRKMQSMSGIVSIGVSTPPLHSCTYQCSFCPTPLNENNELRVPKSYDETESAIARGLRNQWKGHLQVYERGNNLMKMGHMMDKLEIIVRGGTFHCYSEKIQIQFITEIYYGANTFYEQYNGKKRRTMATLDEEVQMNKTTKCRIIGLTVETRPDFAIVNFSNLHLYPDEKHSFIRKRLYHIIRNLRRFGCTRIEFGIQHTDNNILSNVNRNSIIEDAIYSIRLMKNSCFKIVGHWMPDLPGSSYEKDKDMMDYVIHSEDLQLDDWKIYPTATAKNTEIFQWYKDGDYEPYSEKRLDLLINLCIYIKTNIPKWIRIDRLIRDIPSTKIAAGYQGKTNLRQIIQKKMKNEGLSCNCLRCKEVKNRTKNINNAKLCVNKYKSSQGEEYFISFESCKCKICWRYYLFMIVKWMLFLIGIHIYWRGCKYYHILYGFCRLRITKNQAIHIFPELQHSTLVRELKVYGKVIPHFIKKDIKKKTQHNGFGKRLMKMAETISKRNHYRRISVINGIGTEEYYVNKLGYKTNGYFVSKKI